MSGQNTCFIDATDYLPSQNIDSFSLFDDNCISEIKNISCNIDKGGIFHISASRLKTNEITGEKFIGGGGLAEMLKAQIPLEKSLNIKSRLFLPLSNAVFYAVCSEVYKLIIGEREKLLSEKECDIYENSHKSFQDQLLKVIETHEPTIILVHDFEYISVVNSLPDNIIKILYWHVDFPSSESSIFPFLQKHIEKYDAIITTDTTIKRTNGSIHKNLYTSPPFINPHSIKNELVSPSDFKSKMATLGIDFSKPILSQIGRFSSQKNPIAAYEVFKGVQKEFPDVQLILAGLFNIPGEDFERTKSLLLEITEGERGVFIFDSATQVFPLTNDEFICGIYSNSDIILNMSTREAFGLVITEAMWHKKPVIAIKSPGSDIQIENKKNGFVVENKYTAIDIALDILHNRVNTVDMTEEAHESVRSKYLVTHYLLKMFKIYAECLERKKIVN